ncbi:MAG: septum formation initiator family protein [Flavobacteriales bacterium]|jgi:hypothetical protein|nr:septum formation initiator family protein [Flavobacteriales bacterium]
MRDRLWELWDRIRYSNRYGLAFGLFLLWMSTMAEVDVFRMINTRLERNHIQARITETEDLIDNLDLQLEEIRTDPSAKERYARESYYMHKPQEDVYVFVEP